MIKNKLFFSLNTKIMLLFFISLSAVSAVIITIFLETYVSRFEQETVLRYRKAQSLMEMYEENLLLRAGLEQSLAFENEAMTPEQVQEFLQKQKESLNSIKPISAMHMMMRRELLNDILSLKRRNVEMEALSYVIFLVIFCVILFLVFMWIVVRRWILQPTEKMLDFTEQISQGDFTAKVPVSNKKSKSDEMDLLSRNLNKMADKIKESVEKLQQSQDFLQRLIDALPEGLRVVDFDGNVLLANKTYLSLFNHLLLSDGQKCYEQKGCADFCHDEDNLCPLRLLNGSENNEIKTIHRYADKNGKDFYLDISAVKVDYNGRLLMLEISRTLDKEIQFSHQQKLSALGLLASSVAHEMRNPLGSIRLILENVLDKMSSKPLPQEDVKRYLKLILEQINFCINVTGRLLKLSRKSNNKYEDINLNEIVEETSGLMEYEAKKRGIEIIHDLTLKDTVIEASDPEMRMIVVNLAQNAFHAMEQGGTLTIKTDIVDDMVVLKISDTGCGIPSKNLKRIFEPFFSNKQDVQAQGTGLGLSIVKTIVEDIHGKISVESQINVGTSFTLLFNKKQVLG